MAESKLERVDLKSDLLDSFQVKCFSVLLDEER
jgi:hypothetical protein